MSEKTVNIHDAKIHPRRPIGRASKPVPGVPRAGKVKTRPRAPDDPLLRVEEYSHEGPTGPTANEELDLAVYGI